jgi:branched-chain amino acid aminotransferase
VPEVKNYAFFQGKFVPMEEAKVSILTHAFMYGTAIFEGIRAYWNEKQGQMYLFRADDHLKRMFDSMKIMHMEISYSVEDISKIMVELLQRNSFKTDTYVRPCVYKAAQTIGPSLDHNPSELSILTVPFGDYFHGAQGLKVCVSNWRRVEDNAIPARAKIVGAYANTALAKTDAVVAGFDDCIVLSESGHVSEGSAMNLFLVKNGVLSTPPQTENILEGITRDTVFNIAEKELHLKILSRSIDRSELYIADELFFCGTGAQIAAIVEVDKRIIGNGSEGPISKMIRERYISICRAEVADYKNWRTPVYPNKS